MKTKSESQHLTSWTYLHFPCCQTESFSVFTGNIIQWPRGFAEAKNFSVKFSVQKPDIFEWKKYIYPTLLCRYWSICVFITSAEKEHFNPCEYGLFGEIMCLMDCSQSLLLLEMFPHLDSKGWKRFLLVAGSRCINMWWKSVPPYWDLFSDISVENNLQFFFFFTFHLNYKTFASRPSKETPAELRWWKWDQPVIPRASSLPLSSWILRYYGMKASIRWRLAQGLGNRPVILEEIAKFAAWVYLFCYFRDKTPQSVRFSSI